MQLQIALLLLLGAVLAGCTQSLEPVCGESCQKTMQPINSAGLNFAFVNNIISADITSAGTQHAWTPGILVRFTNATYAVEMENDSIWKANGRLVTGQPADLILSAIDFNDTGGPLLFNHPGTVATDGTHLLLADRNNNRVLIWNTLPTNNTPPDLVLGQPDFYSNEPGTEKNNLNWPVSVAAADGKVVIADTENDRILIWNSFPTRNGQPADIEIQGFRGAGREREIIWPWGVWTDGKKLAVSSTMMSSVLIWNSFPTHDNQTADIVLSGGMGTPRTITSDGNHLIVGDHNPRIAGSRGQGDFFWKEWPSSNDEQYDFFMSNPGDAQAAWMNGDFTSDGRLIMVGRGLYTWNSFPESEDDAPDVAVERSYSYFGGDGSAIAIAGDRMYISLSNSNKIVAFNSIPSEADAVPDFAIGSPDIHTNTLDTEYIMSNPTPATDGKSLFVSSDFHKLYVWRNIPAENGAHPDVEYNLPDAPWDSVLFNQTLILAGKQSVYIWRTLPLYGELPDETFEKNIGNVSLEELRGVAWDGRYFYLASETDNAIYIWDGIPSKNDNPALTLTIDRPRRLSTDGKYLVVVSVNDKPGGSVKVFEIADIKRGQAHPVEISGKWGHFNLPEDALIADGHLFVADTSFNRVLIWDLIESAISGKTPDVILGAADLDDVEPEIGRDKLFMPGALAWDGSHLWVGEYKFSERLLRFSAGNNS